MTKTTCALCEDVSKAASEAILSGKVELHIDWFGDGVDHPQSDYPAPKPWTEHGSVWIHQDTGEELHRCGSFARTQAPVRRERN